MLRAVLTASLVFASGCKQEPKQPEAPPKATISTGTVSGDGTRTIAIEAGADGYVPDRIPGRPGEKLNLKFTRTVDGDCLSELKVPGGKTIPLPKGTAVEVPVTVPASGEVQFACGMDMYRGVVVAEQAAAKS